MPFEGVSDLSLYPLMINPHFETRDALEGIMVFNGTPFPLAPLRENNKSDELVDPIPHECPPKSIPTSIIFPPSSLLQSFYRSFTVHLPRVRDLHYLWP